MWRKLALHGILPAALAVPAAAQPKAAQSHAEPEYVLEVTGSDGNTFSAECEIDTNEGAVKVDIAEAVPVRRTFRGRGLSCSITQTGANGDITVNVTSPKGSVTRSRTSGTGSTVRLTLR